MSRKQSRERTEAILAEPESLDSLLDAISEGVTLSAWCRKKEALYGKTYEWLHSDPDRVSRYAKAMEARTHNLTERVVDGLTRVMDADPRKGFDKHGNPLAVHALPDELALVVTGHERSETDDGKVTTKIRYVPRDRAHEMLGRHLKMFTDKVEMSGNLGIAERLERARKRTMKEKKG